MRRISPWRSGWLKGCTGRIVARHGLRAPENRNATFHVFSGVAVKGSYAGIRAPDPNRRDVQAYETILSGDLAGDDVLSEDPCDFVPAPNEGRWDRPDRWCLLIESTRREDSLHVVTSSSAGQCVVLDGLTVTAGNAYLPPYLWAGRDPVLIIRDEDCSGGLFHQEGPLVLTACRFISNSAFARAGGVYIHASEQVIMKDCLFLDNFSFRGIGGASFVQIPEVTMSGCTFERNSSWYTLSALHLADCTFEATDCEFVDNMSMYAREPAVLIAGTMTSISRSAFIKNDQGALVVRYSDLSIDDSKFRGNAAAYGAAMNIEGGKVDVSRCSFSDNHAGRRGGGIHNRIGKLLIERTLFSGNGAEEQGGCLYTSRSETTISNCTFANNRASLMGGAIATYYEDSTSVVNSVLSANLSPQGSAVFAGEYPDGSHPSTVTVSYCLLERGRSNIALDPHCILVWGESNISGDPCLANPGYWDSNGTPDSLSDDYWVDGDYHLKSQAGRWDPVGSNWVKDELTSPCIDAGDPNSPVGQETFPNGGRINMGAYGGTAEASKSYFGGPVCETQIPGDINGDCRVDAEDLAMLGRNWLRDERPKSSSRQPPGEPRR